jgi:Ca2+-binding EF-hand superfamily protein
MAKTLFRKPSRQEIEQTFHLFDKDGSGSISADELRSVFRKLGKPFNKNEISKMVNKLDKDGSGGINLSEFEELLNQSS